jgi:hypothetical protein
MDIGFSRLRPGTACGIPSWHAKVFAIRYVGDAGQQFSENMAEVET